MRKPRPIFALAYDFDGTLAPGNMQEHSFIPALGMKAEEFWKESNSLAKEQEGDPILLYMHKMLDAARGKLPVRRRDFVEHGANVKLFDGVEDWFPRITKAGRALGLDVRHFIISSGLREIIEGTPIGRRFERIYASAYLYDPNEVAITPALAINYTNKTQYLFRINKWKLDVADHHGVNAPMAKAERPVPFERMIFLGDGETDVPCFRTVTEQGGTSIAVYRPRKPGAKEKAEAFLTDGRVRFATPADYREGKALEARVLAVLEKAAAEVRLLELPGVT
jgi:phosphoserine phosphatase